MQTYSHLIITAALNKRYKQQDDPPIQPDTRAFLLGSFMPDVGLILLSAGVFVQAMLGDIELTSELYDQFYFTNPVWIVSHSIFHSPPTIAAIGGVGWLFRDRAWGRALLWFGLGCALHSAIDIVTHHNDGPLLFFPFDLETRFSSPVSYWDPDHYGLWFATIEHLLDLVLLGYLFRWRGLFARLRGKPAPEQK